MSQFTMALAEMAQGAAAPSILPVWKREFLYARDPPRVTFPHPEYDDVVHTEKNIIMIKEMTEKSFFFGPTEISALRRFVPEHLKGCTTFEVLTASFWRCRTIALQPSPEEDMRLMFFVNSRGKFNPPIPVGYYGNCVVLPCVVSKAEDLCNKPLGYALELVMKAKASVTEEYVRSTADLMVVKGRPHYKTDSTYIVTSLTRGGLNKANFGWGEAIYAGPPNDDQDIPGLFSMYLPSTNDNGESGIIVLIGLPIPAMELFINELKVMLT
ncbi:putative benzyl alcohol O-benzoyltransferase [Helianthus annuus]|nr:putative benzyl alcohol O-benzoyltransferase [Helianthus annuus]